MIYLKRLYKLGALFLLTTTVCNAQWGTGETHAPYAITEHGTKAAFSELTKAQLGLRCTVYLKHGTVFRGGSYHNVDKNAIVYRDNRILISGELYELNKYGIHVEWFGNPLKGTTDWTAASEDQIDFILFAKADKETK